MRRTGTCVLALAVLSFLVSRGATKGGEDKGTTLTEKDSGKKIELKKGDLLSLKLEMTAGTGFTWVIAKNETAQLAPQGKPTVIPAKKGVVGGKATQVFQFKAAAEGTSDLELHYRRPFEKDKEPAKTFKVTVEVK
jgi:inhibitor of cysteine peptidase